MRPNGAGWALLPLRLFLGGTFVFAGLQKLADPGFFDAAKTGSIQYQIHAYAPSSPLRPLLDLAAHVPVLVGVLIALGEVAAGVGAITGLWTRVAAAGGMAISLLLFLTVSYQVAPFYLGSDIVFLFAWTPLALAGAGGAWSLDEALRRRREPAPASGVPAGAPPRLGVAAQGGGPSRRDFLAGGTAAAVVAAVGLVAAALAAGLGRLGGGVRGPGAPVSSGKAPAPPPAGAPIANVAAVGVGQAVPFTDPGTDDPAFVAQPEPGKFVAFDAVCPHARCYVHYQAGSRQFVCPCHGSRFDGATGAVLQGPAVTGLAPIPLKVTGGGSIYVA